MTTLPTGTVTFLFTDIEGSTTLLQRLGDRRYAEVLDEHRRILRDAFAGGNGQEIDTQGDAFLVAFSRARDALGTAVAAQRALTQHVWPDGAALRVRMGLHTGEPLSGDSGYVGIDVHRAARMAAAGHGGQILVSDVTHGLVARDLPDGVSLRDLGEHRLKDLTHPHHLFQVIAGDLPIDFPAIRALDVLPNNLPRQLTSFIGREKEMNEVKRLLSTAYLVTLTGSGGAGKTRLALQVAADLLDQYPDGVWLAQLASLSDPGLVPKAVASALGIPEQPGHPLTETLADYLRSRSVLLLVDNCEHLLQACADLTDALLQACPNLRILATSREALGIAGELTYRVPSLSLPDLHRLPPPETITQYEAVRLFVERAAFSKPGFKITTRNVLAVAQVTHRLDGIPLAIELAAARAKALTMDVIAARLDDRFRLLTGGSRIGLPHHQTLRATLDWSYDLLSEPERILLQRLSVFAGGVTLEAAEKICAGEGLDEGDILDLLTHLVDKSLVVFDERDGHARYRLLETVRQYGRDRLRDSGEADDVRRRHRDWYQGLAEQAELELRGPGQLAWFERLEIEHDNLRAALELSLTAADGAEAGLRLASALYYFWFVRGHWGEGRRWLEKALERSHEVPASILVKALQGAAFLARRQGDYERAAPLVERGLALSRELGDKRYTSSFLMHYGLEALYGGRYDRAGEFLEEALALARDLGDEWLIRSALGNLGTVAKVQGKLEQATALFTETLALARKCGDKAMIAYGLVLTSTTWFLRGELERAASLYAQALAEPAVGKREATHSIEGLAQVSSARGRHEHAARLFGAAEVSREALGLRKSAMVDEVLREKWLARTRVALEDSIFEAALAEGRAMTLEQATEYALKEEPRDP